MTVYTPRDFDPFSGFGTEEEDNQDSGMPAVFAVIGAIFVPLGIALAIWGLPKW